MSSEKIQKIKSTMAQRMIEHNRIIENSKYGKFIIQTNEVQLLLILLIWLKTNSPRKELKEYLEKSTLGNLIYSFNICAKNSGELSLINSLESYSASRNALAHKMYSKKKLTLKDCELAINLGEEILKKINTLLKPILPKNN